MRLSLPRLLGVSLLAVSTVSAAGWGFEDGTVTIAAKGAGLGAGKKEKLSPTSSISSELSLDTTDTLKLAITTLDGKSNKRPHQAFFTLHDPSTGLEESFPLNVKESGKAKLELSQKDLPAQFLASKDALVAKVTIASFGTSKPFSAKVFNLRAVRDATAKVPVESGPLRYGKLSEIHHIFRSDPTSPPRVISFFFALAVLATLPLLLGSWLALGANLDHFGKAFNGAPVSHALFLGSIVGIEGVFFLYYTTWNLFQTLPVAAGLGLLAIFSGSRALTEVQERRLAGER